MAVLGPFASIPDWDGTPFPASAGVLRFYFSSIRTTSKKFHEEKLSLKFAPYETMIFFCRRRAVQGGAFGSDAGT